MKRTWLQLIRSCTLQIASCPNFETEGKGLEMEFKGILQEGERSSKESLKTGT
jgi:hypothetical protein